ncbi:hypothetical protein BMEI0059 [Brucella melitensis bv. 1 str. 16M]|uniref:Uncharacterized protein n=1 Tax=Brucella melitensis biotype 1 (strain ATCC 23456 / CCUG 17765 / NCTC 10094 / 16M) TaxID=224914 RepID=Q8YJM3_BRUME|nr:hypothetical protein BMEI0059 [Brucella melitensis bv. 1 str. 16M]
MIAASKDEPLATFTFPFGFDAKINVNLSVPGFGASFPLPSYVSVAVITCDPAGELILLTIIFGILFITADTAILPSNIINRL